jgi:baculoviral IAP repeat-containing protein 6
MSINEELNKWKYNTSYINILNCITNNNVTILKLKVGSQYFNINIPNEYPNTIDLIILDYDYLIYDFISNVNTKIIDNNIKTLYDVLDLINNEYKLHYNLQNDEIHNIDDIIYRRQLQLQFRNNQHNDINKDIPILFESNESYNILLNELFSCRTIYNNKGNIYIDVIDNDILQWKIQYRRFKSNTLNKELMKYNYNSIDLYLCFNDTYPSYPPYIRNIEPRLSDYLNYKIPSMKMIQLQYWSPCRGIQYIIDKIYHVLNQYGKIHSIQNIDAKYDKLDGYLIRLNTYCSLEDIDNSSYIKIYHNNHSTQQSKYWSSGTGYGDNSTSDWNINEYVQQRKDTYKQLELLLTNIDEELKVISDINDIRILLEDSQLINLLETKLTGITLLEMSYYKELYITVFNIIRTLYKEQIIKDSNIYDLLKILSNDSELDINICKESDLANIIIDLYKLIEPLHNNNKDNNIIVNNSYEDTMKVNRFRMDEYNFNKDNNFRYNPLGNDSVISDTIPSRIQRRLAKEFVTLNRGLPIHFNSSILVRVDEINNRLIKALITGPIDTPYDSGIYIFNIYIPDSYPSGPPKMIHENNGNKRINPNIYNNGKVCLSLLGTWNGRGGENWNSRTSTLLQLLISVQSQILIDKPIFNEPGHETDIGSDYGNRKNKDYNQYIRYFNMCHSMIDILNNIDKYICFKDIIINHFKYKKDHINNTIKEWIDDSFTIHNSIHHNGLLIWSFLYLK